jgi:hypothetical protein
MDVFLPNNGLHIRLIDNSIHGNDHNFRTTPILGTVCSDIGLGRTKGLEPPNITISTTMRDTQVFAIVPSIIGTLDTESVPITGDTIQLGQMEDYTDYKNNHLNSKENTKQIPVITILTGNTWLSPINKNNSPYYTGTYNPIGIGGDNNGLLQMFTFLNANSNKITPTNVMYSGNNVTDTFYNIDNSAYGFTGTVGIGTTMPMAALDVWGDIYARGSFYAGMSGGIYTTSDRKLKNSITPIESSNATNFLSQLRPVSYKWNQSNLYPGVHNGFVAQDVQSANPQLVRYLDDKLHYDPTTFIPFIVKSLQDYVLPNSNSNSNISPTDISLPNLYSIIQQQQELITSMLSRIESLEKQNTVAVAGAS